VRETIIEATIEALCSVTNPRLFHTERGYQGAFFCALQRVLEEKGIVDGACILEMEYQKSGRHGTRQRPDIILHVPVEISDSAVTENNFAVWALKREAGTERAMEDFQKLDAMLDHLKYPLGFFINIASTSHHLEEYKGDFLDRLVAIAVNLRETTLVIKSARWLDGNLVEETIEVAL